MNIIVRLKYIGTVILNSIHFKNAGLSDKYILYVICIKVFVDLII